MATFAIDVTDLAQLAGLKAARDAYNAALPGAPLPVEQRPGFIATDGGYLRARVVTLLTSYVKQHEFDVVRLHELEAKVVELQSKFDAAGIPR